jgi:hypothetical protein
MEGTTWETQVYTGGYYKMYLEGPNVRVSTRFEWLRIRPSGGSCEHCNEASGFYKSREFLGKLNDYQLLKQDCSPWSSLHFHSLKFLSLLQLETVILKWWWWIEKAGRAICLQETTHKPTPDQSILSCLLRRSRMRGTSNLYIRPQR